MELAHSFNIRLTSEIQEKIRTEQEKLSKRFTELRFYDSAPHFSVGTKFMSEEETAEYAEALKKEFQNDKAWELEFSDFSLSTGSETGRYIFLNLDARSSEYVYELNKRLLAATKGIGLETPGGLPAKFPYSPHISLMKLRHEDAEEGLRLVRNDFAGLKMPVTLYELTRQQTDETGFSTFPVVTKIYLNK